MSQPDDSLQILIRMTADLSGAKEAGKALDDLGKKTKEASGETEEAGKALDDLGKNTKKASGETEKHNVHLHAMHRLFHSLNEIAPGLGVFVEGAWQCVHPSPTIRISWLLDDERLELKSQRYIAHISSPNFAFAEVIRRLRQRPPGGEDH